MKTRREAGRNALLCAVLLAMVFTMAFSGFALAAGDGEYYMTWEEYVAANGITSWNWNDAADAIEGVANHAVELYEAGEQDEAYEYAKATYWGYYETTGFERNVMTYVSGSRVSAVELQFTNFRKSIKKDLGLETVQAEGQALSDMLHEDAQILSPEGAVNGSAGAAANGEYYLTWEEYVEANQIASWNWNDAADAIEGVANHAVELYEAGEQDEAYEYAKATYWGYYETTGFERNVMTYVSGSRVSAVELQFTNFRKSIKKDLGLETVQAEGQALSDMLHEDAQILSPEGPIAGLGSQTAGDTAMDVSSGKSSGGAVATFIGSLGIIVREGLEAILIVGAIIAYLVKSGNKQGVIPVYVGSVFAIVCSFAMAGLLSWLKSINPETTMSQEVIEGVAALLAVAVLFYVSNWMVSKSESAAWTAYIQDKAKGSVSGGSMFTLGFTAWLAVFREGAEVILFYQPMLAEEHKNMVWLGFGIGCVVLVAVFLAMRIFSVRLPLKPFFMAMSILMAFMCVCFLGAGIKELMEGGVFDSWTFMFASPGFIGLIPYNDVLDVLGIYPLAGTLIPQIVLAVVILITFVIATRRNEKIRAEAEAKKAAGGEPSPAPEG